MRGREKRSPAALALSLVVAASAIGCAEPTTGTDGGRGDERVEVDTSVDDGGMLTDSDVPRDADVDDGGAFDAGPRELRVVGGFGTTAGTSSGSLHLVAHGFEWSATTCAGTLCATGTFRQ